MRNLTKTITIFSLFLCIFAANSNTASAVEFKHIEKLFDLRSSIAEQGQVLPAAIRSSSGNDIRILERIFELNTSALTTIEAYFRIFKVTFATSEGLTPATEKILNEWLSFISSQCNYDYEYLQEAKFETKNAETLKQLNTSQDNIKRLSEITSEGIDENSAVLAEMNR